MARKEIAVKKYVVTLSNEEREHLTALILPAVAMSSVPGRPAAWNRPTRSTWPRPPRRRCAASLNLVNACESGRPRTLLRPAADASSRPCRHWSPAPPRSGCRSSPHHRPRRRLSTGFGPSAAFVLDGVRYG